jgi:hypothetical protein
MENIVGFEHKYRNNLNATNVFEILLLEKYPFSCWTPFDEKSVTAHLAVYIYTAIQLFMSALKTGSIASTGIGILIYITVQFKLVSNSLEELSNIEDSLDEQHTCKKYSCRNSQISAKDGNSFHNPSQAQIR